MEALPFAVSCIWAGVSQFPRMLRAVHWHQTWGIVVSWLWKRLSVHWAWGSSFKHELPGNPRVSGCLNRTVGKVIIGGFNLDKGRLSRCYREISEQTVPSCPLMLFQAHKTEKGIGGNMAKWGRHSCWAEASRHRKAVAITWGGVTKKQFMHRLRQKVPNSKCSFLFLSTQESHRRYEVPPSVYALCYY